MIIFKLPYHGQFDIDRKDTGNINELYASSIRRYKADTGVKSIDIKWEALYLVEIYLCEILSPQTHSKSLQRQMTGQFSPGKDGGEMRIQRCCDEICVCLSVVVVVVVAVVAFFCCCCVVHVPCPSITHPVVTSKEDLFF